MATTSSLERWRPRSVAVAGAATAAVLSIFGGASSIGASGETSSTDDTHDHHRRGDDDGARPPRARHRRPPSRRRRRRRSSQRRWRRRAKATPDTRCWPRRCRNAALPDGSLRVVNVLQTCDVEFIGAVDAELGRPLTNVEELIADPVNNVTPNQAQRDVLNAELAVYWRLAEAWAQAQAGAGAPTEDTEATADTAPTSVDEPATTGG